MKNNNETGLFIEHSVCVAWLIAIVRKHCVQFKAIRERKNEFDFWNDLLFQNALKFNKLIQIGFHIYAEKSQPK